MKIFLKILNISMTPVTLLVGLFLFISGQAPSLSPVHSSLLALMGMSFPIWVLLNILILIYWAIQLKFRALIPLFLLIFHIKPMGLYVQLNPSSKDTNTASIKVISYNANLFGINNDQWYLDSVVSIIQEENPDVLLMQEIYSKDVNLKKLVKNIGKNLNLPYHAIYPLSTKKNYGMCIWSKFKIKNWNKVYFPHETGNMAMFADINLPPQNQTFRLYNIHLQSIRFNKHDYQTMEEVNAEKSFNKAKTENIINRIRKAYEKRAPQVDILKKEIETCDLPKMVVGDFNDVPVSYTYYQLIDGLNDAFVSRGNGLETTYKGPFPSFRIDYQLFSDELECLGYKSIKKAPSDHKMISVEYSQNSH